MEDVKLKQKTQEAGETSLAVILPAFFFHYHNLRYVNTLPVLSRQRRKSDSLHKNQIVELNRTHEKSNTNVVVHHG